MICTIYSHNIGFDKILDIVRRIYPSGKLDINSEDEFQVVTIEIKGGFFKSSKKIKIPYRQCNGHLPQITDSDESPLAINIRGLYRYVSSLPTTNEKIKDLFLQKIISLNSEFSIIPEQGDSKEIKTLIQALAQAFDAILFVQPGTVISKSSGQHFLDKNLNLIIDGDGNCEINDLDVIVNSNYPEAEKREVTAEQNERKEKNEKAVAQRNIKINKYLPCIEKESETIIRTAKAIAERLTVLAITNMVAFDVMPGEEAVEYLQKNNFWDKVTPDEKSFLADPSDEKKILETWKCEAIWVLMWALKKVDELGFPDKLCDLNNISYTDYPVGKDKDPNEFVNHIGEPRTKSEILDANDLYYRLHWACVDARINNKSIDDLNSDVVYERHYALNWLINYMEQEWDDISCDT